MISALELRLNPIAVRTDRGLAVRLEGRRPGLVHEPPEGPAGDLVRETLRRYRRRPLRLRFPGGSLRLGRKTWVMGILNVTPDSFSDGGAWMDPEEALAHAREMVRDGAGIIDVGGESTRPGARPVPAEEEKRRVLPVVARLAREGILVSIDTSKAAVAEAAFRAGARILNDVTALRGDPRMARAAARAGAAVLLMHMQGTPRTMQKHPRYGNVVADLCRFFRKRLKIALSAGIPRDKILLDPGIGFGKLPEHNVEILRRLDEFRSLGCALAVGTSRKSFIGHFLGRKVHERVSGTAATVAAAVLRGADVVRVHDVREMTDVARMSDLLR